jgi:hypothetical protein
MSEQKKKDEKHFRRQAIHVAVTFATKDSVPRIYHHHHRRRRRHRHHVSCHTHFLVAASSVEA